MASVEQSIVLSYVNNVKSGWKSVHMV
ncbi:hypothetical protein C5167_028640 [Papaver somniferum]|nr:hypothetical protein C5167_028640 [Papaver somniferum]